MLRMVDKLAESYVSVAVFMVTAAMCFMGVGMPFMLCILGLALCVLGLAQKSFHADWCIIVPFMVYNVASMASSFVNRGDIMQGYAPFQMILPVLYLISSSLPQEHSDALRKWQVLWAGAVAGLGMLRFLARSSGEGAVLRMSGIFGNANVTGIFLVMAWLALSGMDTDRCRQGYVLRSMEPAILSALALTLSMGSFVAMAAGVLATLVGRYRRERSWSATLDTVRVLLARAVLGMSPGLLMYVAMSRTDIKLLGWLIGAYICILVFCWDEWLRFLVHTPRVCAAIGLSGACLVGIMVLLRPSAFATFAERIAMMRNGLGYVLVDPLVGVGAFEWRGLNMADGDKFFNTWTIHNVLIHAAVEFGLAAMAMLAVIAVRVLVKRQRPGLKPAFVAFAVHNMMDVSFFYVGAVGFLIGLTVDPGSEKSFPPAAARLVFLLAGAFFIYVLCRVPLG